MGSEQGEIYFIGLRVDSMLLAVAQREGRSGNYNEPPRGLNLSQTEDRPFHLEE